MVVSITVTVKREPCLGREGFATRGEEERSGGMICVVTVSFRGVFRFRKSMDKLYKKSVGDIQGEGEQSRT